MEAIAKFADTGKTDDNGNMDYGIEKGTYLGHDSEV